MKSVSQNEVAVSAATFATDAVSAATLHTVYSWDTTPTALASWTTYSGPTSPTTDGTHTLYFYSYDAGVSTETVQQTQPFFLATQQPVVTIQETVGGTGPSIPATPVIWSSKVTTANLTVSTNGGKTVSHIYYQYAGASTWTTATGTSPNILLPEGNSTLYAYAVDASGTAGPIASQAFMIDLTKPVVGLITPGTVYSSNPTLTVPVTETGSGFATGTVSVGDAYLQMPQQSWWLEGQSEQANVYFSAGILSFKFINPLTPGLNSVRITVTDLAGNMSNEVVDVVNYGYANTVNVNATAGAHGSISPVGIVSVSVNTTPTFNVAADQGYVIDTLLVDGSPVSAAAGLTTYSYALTVGTVDHDVLATFKASSPTPPSGPTATTISLKGTATTILRYKYLGLSTVLSGGVPAGTMVRYEIKKPHSNTYVLLTTRSVNAAGAVNYRYKMPARGTYYFRVRFLGTSAFKAVCSLSWKVICK